MTVQRWSPDGSTMIAVPNGRFVLGTDYDAMLDAQRGLTAKAEADAADARKRATEAERYVAGQDVRSDFATAAEMRAALDAATRENADLRATCQTLAVMVYNSRYLGFDREWIRSQIAGIANERAREMLLALDAKTRGEA